MKLNFYLLTQMKLNFITTADANDIQHKFL